jgi:hypothetical protein
VVSQGFVRETRKFALHRGKAGLCGRSEFSGLIGAATLSKLHGYPAKKKECAWR